MNSDERKKHRQQRINDLLRQHFDNNQAVMADNIGISPSLLNRYLNGKGIGESMVAKIEDGAGFPGWFAGAPTNQANEAPNGEYKQATAVTRHHQRAGHMVEIAPAQVTLNLPVECLTLWDNLQKLSPKRQKVITTVIALEAAQADVEQLGIDPAPLDIKPPTAAAYKPDKPVPKVRDPA